MASGWTGGQFSLWRVFVALLAIALATRDGALFVDAALDARTASAGLALVASVALLVGWRSRTSALVVLASLASLEFQRADDTESGVYFLGGALLALVCAPPDPFLSFDARGRVDPVGPFVPPGRVAAMVQLALLAWSVPAAIAASDATDTALHGALIAALFVGAAVPRARMSAAALALVLVSFLPFATDIGGLDYALHLVLIALVDPGFVRGRKDSALPTLFYDGECGVCHASVRFLIAEDTRGDALRFAPLDSPAFERALPVATRHNLPDSVVLVGASASGLLRVDVRSAAAIGALERLGGWWRVIAACVRLVPRPIADACYDAFARIRKRLVSAPTGACPMLPEHVRRRFVDLQ